ncbi:MAG: OsmC family protein [Clostridia bacterium]
MGDLKFSITAKSENPTKTVVLARGFKIIVDEPTELGGTDAGANPVEYVLAALAGCLNVVGHVVAKEMQLKLGGLEINIEGDLNPAKFMGGSAADRAGYKEIRVIIRPEMEAESAVMEKWLATIKERCPVSDNIANATPVKITIG